MDQCEERLCRTSAPESSKRPRSGFGCQVTRSQSADVREARKQVRAPPNVLRRFLLLLFFSGRERFHGVDSVVLHCIISMHLYNASWSAHQ